MHGFWWHLWNDPVAHNPWSFGALVLLLVGTVVYAVAPSWRRK